MCVCVLCVFCEFRLTQLPSFQISYDELILFVEKSGIDIQAKFQKKMFLDVSFLLDQS